MGCASFSTRFDCKVTFCPTTGCWLWLGPYNKDGYGKIQNNNKSLLAHRVSYERFIGPIPEGMLVLHRCNLTSCVNPDHLKVGDSRENAKDRMKAGSAVGGQKKGYVPSEEARQKISTALTGKKRKPFTPTHCARLAAAAQRRRNLSRSSQ